MTTNREAIIDIYPIHDQIQEILFYLENDRLPIEAFDVIMEGAFAPEPYVHVEANLAHYKSDYIDDDSILYRASELAEELADPIKHLLRFKPYDEYINVINIDKNAHVMLLHLNPYSI